MKKIIHYGVSTFIFVIGLFLFIAKSFTPNIFLPLDSLLPIPYLTIIGLILLGLSLLLFKKMASLRGIIGIIITSIGVLSITEYVLHSAIFLNLFFINSKPESLTPGIALCFIFTGTIFTLDAFFSTKKWSGFFIIFLICIVCLLALYIIYSHLSQLHTGSTTENVFYSEIITALLFLIVILIYIPLSIERFKKSKSTEGLLFCLCIAGIGTGFFLLNWQILINFEENNIQTKIDTELNVIVTKLGFITRSISDLLNNISTNITVSDKKDLEEKIKKNLVNFPEIEWISLKENNSEKIIYNLEVDENKNSDICKNLFKKDLKSNVQSFKMVANYFCYKNSDSTIYALVNFDKIIKTVFSNFKDKDFGAEILINNFPFKFYSTTEKNLIKSKWIFSKTLNVLNNEINIFIWPTKKFIKDNTTLYPHLFLMIGILVTIFIVFVIRLLQLSSIKNKLLMESQNRFITLIESSPQAILVVSHGGKILQANEHSTKLFEYTRFELLTMSIENILTKKTNDSNVFNLLDLLKNPNKNIRKDIYILSKSGKQIPVEVVLTPIEIDGEPCLLFSIIDLSEITKAHTQLEKYAAELQLSNQSLDDFAYIASHDLKEPLRGISNFAGFLYEDYQDKLDNEGKKQLLTLQNLSKRMIGLIDALLTYSRVGRTDLALKQCDIQEIIMEKIRLLSIFLTENNAKVVIEKKMPTIVCDGAMIGEVFYNLIVNGIKYNQSEDKKIIISYEDKDDYHVFSVKDNGIGIAKEHFEQIFKIFKRLHAREEFGGGIGAGMTIIQKIIERHLGKIWLNSTVGKGSTFYFSIKKIK